MEIEKNDEVWKQAMAKFSEFSDGFWIMGYDKVTKNKICFGLSKNTAASDGLFLIQRKAIEWIGEGMENMEEGNLVLVFVRKSIPD